MLVMKFATGPNCNLVIKGCLTKIRGWICSLCNVGHLCHNDIMSLGALPHFAGVCPP